MAGVTVLVNEFVDVLALNIHVRKKQASQRKLSTLLKRKATANQITKMKKNEGD